MSIIRTTIILTALLLGACDDKSPVKGDPGPALKKDKEISFDKHCNEIKGSISVDYLSHSICNKPDGTIERE